MAKAQQQQTEPVKATLNRPEILQYSDTREETKRNAPKVAAKETTTIFDEFEELEQSIVNDDGQVDHAKLRLLEKQRGIQPLANVDHSQIEHEEFNKNFYQEHPEIQAIEFDGVNKKR